MLTAESSSSVLEFAVLPIAKVLIMCSLGYLMASPRINILTSENRKILSKLVFALFLPCLIFTELGSVITAEKILLWWFIPVNVLLGSVFGCLFGYLVALIVRPPPKFFNLVVVMIGIGNIGNIPLVLIEAICRDSSNPFGTDCETNGVAYISFGQWVGALIVYTFVFHMLAPPVKEDNFRGKQFPVILDAQTFNRSNSSDSVDLVRNDIHSYYSREEEEDMVVDGESKLLASVEEGDESELEYQLEVHTTFYAKFYGGLCWVYHELRLKDILQPPVVASILAMIIGCFTPLRNITFTDPSPFFFFVESLNLMGDAMIPCIMLTLGGNLVGGPGASALGMRTTVAITIARLLFTPLIGVAVVTTAEKLGLFPTDDMMFKFVLLLQHSMPTSILAGAVANLRGFGAKEATAILFWQHIFAIMTIAGWLSFYLNYLLV